MTITTIWFHTLINIVCFFILVGSVPPSNVVDRLTLSQNINSLQTSNDTSAPLSTTATSETTSETTSASTTARTTITTTTTSHKTTIMQTYFNVNTTKSSSQILIEFCSNFTSCDSCMSAESLYEISCSWKQYDKNGKKNSNKSVSFCTHIDECNDNPDFHCCNRSYCCDCLKQSSCKMCGAQGLNSSCTWDHTIDSCFEHSTCIGMF